MRRGFYANGKIVLSHEVNDNPFTRERNIVHEKRRGASCGAPGGYCQIQGRKMQRSSQSFGAVSSVNITMTQVMRPYKAKVGNSDNINTKTVENALTIRITGSKTAAMLKRECGMSTAMFLDGAEDACRRFVDSNFQNRLQQFRHRKGRM